MIISRVKTLIVAFAAVGIAAPVMALADEATDFSGAYAGVMAGVDRTKIDGAAAPMETKNTGSFGVQGGYNWKADELLFGVLASYNRNQNKCHAYTDATGGEFCYGTNIFGLGAKLGYQIGGFLPYVKGGVNRISGRGDASGVAVNDPFLGIGAEYRIGAQTTLGLDWTSTTGKHESGAAEAKNHNNMLTVGLNYYFDTPKAAPAPAPVAAPEPAPAPEPVVEAPAPVPEPAPVEAPVSPVEQALAENRVVTLEGVHFAFKSAELKPSADQTLDDVVKFANAHPDAKLEISGHTDDVGKNWSKSRNQPLSEERAAAVKAYLVSKGVAADRISTAGYSYTRPVADNSTEVGRAQNRRVEIRANYTETK